MALILLLYIRAQDPILTLIEDQLFCSVKNLKLPTNMFPAQLIDLAKQIDQEITFGNILQTCGAEHLVPKQMFHAMITIA